MDCPKSVRLVTGILHTLAILVVVIGSGVDVYNLMYNRLATAILPVAIAVMLLLCLPDQICVAVAHADGWLSVIGTVLLFVAWLLFAFVIAHKQRSARLARRKRAEGTTPPATQHETATPCHAN
jgi:hypothetical protein